MYALLVIQGEQIRAEPGRWILVPYLKKIEKGKNLSFDSVVLFSDSEQAKYLVGTPYVKGIQVTAQVLEPLVKEKKIIVFKYKRRKNYRRKKGHRQWKTKLLIENILIGKESSENKSTEKKSVKKELVEKKLVGKE